MHHALRFLLWLDWIVALAWLTRIVYWLRGVAQVSDLSRSELAPRAAIVSPRLSVIVPARNEERAIAGCLQSLLASTGVTLDIIAVDDRSTDATGNIMDALEASHGSRDEARDEPSSESGSGADAGRRAAHTLRIIHIDLLPDGWMGKTHAMARAAVETSGEWLLFTDGDVLFQPDTLARAMAFAEHEQADHVVLYPTMILRDAGERMMMAFLHAMSIWGVRPWKVGDAQARNDFIGIGAFNLVRRSVYDAVGGWGALRMEVLEDLRMGFTVKRAGYRQRAVYGPHLARLRWAEGALGMVANMTKNLFALFRFRLLVASLALGSLVPLCLLPLAGLGLGWVGKGWPGWASTGVAPCLLMFGALALLYRKNMRLGLPGATYVLSFPIGSGLFLFAIARSIVATVWQGGVNWRGTFYPLKELRRHAGPLR